MNLPLEGKKVLVTRGANQAKELAQLISKLGGVPLQVPLLTYKRENKKENEQIVSSLNQFDWIFFTSANGVHFFIELLKDYNAALPSHTKIGAVGTKTADRLVKYNIPVHFIPSIFNADSMVEELPLKNDKEKVLLVQGNLSRDVLPKFFEEQQISFQPIVVYKTTINEIVKEDLHKVLRHKDIDVLTFTSPSCVQAFVQLGEKEARNYLNTLCLCIGTTTENAAREAGFQSILTPKQFTTQDMVETLINYVQKEHKSNE